MKTCNTIKIAVTEKFSWLLIIWTISTIIFLLHLYIPGAYAAQTTLIWVPPITNEDGTPLTDLAGYKVYYGTASRTYTLNISVGNVTTYTVPNLSEGVTYYFAVTAINSSSKESKFSNEISRTMPPKTYTITATAGNGGSITPVGSIVVAHGGTQGFIITANTGYKIARVVVDGSSVSAVSAYTFSNVTANHTIQVNFEATYPNISVTPSYHNFGDVLLGTDPVIKTFTVSNSGTGNLIIGTNILTDSKTAEFILWDDNCSGRTVIPADRCSVAVKFSPISNGPKSAYLVIASNDLDTPTVDIPLNGSGFTEQSNTVVDLPRTGQTVSYTPGDDGDIQAGVKWPEPRFTDNGDGTVTDILTGLMWLKDGVCLSKRNWSSALNTIADFNAVPGQYRCMGYMGSYTDWRMPNVKELESLVNYGVTDSSLWLNTSGFSNIKPVYYWSSTGNQYQAWSVDMRNAIVSPLRKTYTYNVMLVRKVQ